MPTVDWLLAQRRREREERTGEYPPADLSDLLTRLTFGGARDISPDVTEFAEGRGGDEDLLDLLMNLWSQQEAAGRDEVPLWQQEAAEAAETTAAYQRALEMMGLEQAFEREMTGLGRGFERGELERGLGREQQHSLATLGRRQEHERGMGRTAFESESALAGMTGAARKEQRGREMKHSGQASMIDIFGRDPAQSVLFELGAMGDMYGEMPPL